MLIDSAKTSTLEGAATTVYATGGRGNARLLTWEGEKTLTFTVEDALLSPIGFSILSGANLFDYDDQPVHVNRVIRSGLTFGASASNTTYTALYEKNAAGTGYAAIPGVDAEEIAAIIAYYGNDAQLWVPVDHDDAETPATITATEDDPKYYYITQTSSDNTGCTIDLSSALIDNICEEAPIFIDVLKDDSISGDFMAVSADGVNGKTITTDGKIYRYDDAGVKRQVGAITSDNVNDYTVLVNCYTLAANENKAIELQINAEDFAGYFYVEADTLVRRQADGRDLPAILTIPLVKIQSNFSITMASSGDPSGLMRLAA